MRRALAVALAALVAACKSAPGGAADAGADALADAAGDAPAECSAAAPRDVGGLPALSVAGDPGGATLGYGDPSLAYADGAPAGFLTYTAVSIGSAHTRVATSTDRGATWSFVGDVNAATPITVATSDPGVCGAASCGGTWVHEVSSIVEDPTDPDPARRFKVFAHSYLITAGGALRYEIGSIDLWTTAAPGPSAVWAETRLFGWPSSSPRSSTGVLANVATDPVLSPLLGACASLTEPGALVRGGAIDLALGCVRVVSPSDVPIEIVLVRTTDHGATWRPVAKLLDAADATALGSATPRGPEVNAAALFQTGGVTYLFATPAAKVADPLAWGYRGCVAIPFADVEAGRLARCGGALEIASAFQGPAGLFNGACTWAAGASAAGLMGLTADTTRPAPFQIFATGAAP